MYKKFTAQWLNKLQLENAIIDKTRIDHMIDSLSHLRNERSKSHAPGKDAAQIQARACLNIAITLIVYFYDLYHNQRDESQ